MRHLVTLAAGLAAALPAPAQPPPHWAFQKPHAATPPKVRDAAWVKTPVDAFVRARLDRAGLAPNPPADRATLLRRVTFDLTGLPPTPDEIDAFLTDTRPDAYVRVVERLLASPHYGERWAQHWLDVVRYAESNGYELDAERAHAWRYRDYVVQALNDDVPYDRFLREQLAGDLLARRAEKADAAERARWHIAAGMNRCGPAHLVSGNLDPDVLRQETLTEMTTTVGAAFLGLTLACARCHDHKFDPVSQKEYYQVEAFFAAAKFADVPLATDAEKDAHDARLKEHNAKLEPIKKRLAAVEGPYRQRLTEAKKAKLEPAYRAALEVPADKRTPEQKKLAGHAATLIKVTWDEVVDALTAEDAAERQKLRDAMHRIEAARPEPPAQAWTVADGGGALAAHVLKRGDPKKKGERVEPAFPAVLGDLGAKADGPRDRGTLADWLTHPDHPLTGRVIVNRLWQHHFGRGLVATPNDFGVQTPAPDAQDLLDWLAVEVVRRKWSLKEMHRLMVLSNTYQQSSRPTDKGREVDPENKLWGRMNRQRLTGEALRDATLAAAGTFNPKRGGPPVRVPLEPAVYDLIFTEGEPDGLWPVTPDPREHARRSLYLFNKRNVRQPLLEAFDQPDTLTPCPVRPTSTFAPQALILLNGPFAQAQSKAFAARLLHAESSDPAAQVRRAYRSALARDPRPAETRTAVEFLDAQAERIRDRLRARRTVEVPPDLPEGVDPARAAALADFCLAMLNRNEFLYVD